MSGFSPPTQPFRNQLTQTERTVAMTTVRRRLIDNADSVEIKAGDISFSDSDISLEPPSPPAAMSPSQKSSAKLIVDGKHYLSPKYSSYELSHKKVFDAIQLVKLQKSMLSVDTRISYSRMGVEMIDRQELAIEESFSLVNLYLSKATYYYNKGSLPYGVANRAKAAFVETAAVAEYTRIVLEEAMADAVVDPVFPTDITKFVEWQNRILSDEAVVEAMQKNLATCEGNSAEIVEAKWRLHRAKVVLKADSDAFKAAWPGVKLRSNSMRVPHHEMGC